MRLDFPDESVEHLRESFKLALLLALDHLNELERNAAIARGQVAGLRALLVALEGAGEKGSRGSERRGERERGSGGDFPPAPFLPSTPAPSSPAPQPNPSGNVDLTPMSYEGVNIGISLSEPFTNIDLRSRLDGQSHRCYNWLAAWKRKGWIATVGHNLYRRTDAFGKLESDGVEPTK